MCKFSNLATTCSSELLEQAVLAALRQEADIRRSLQDDPRRDLIAIRKSPSVCRDGRGGGERLPSAGSDYQKTKQ